MRRTAISWTEAEKINLRGYAVEDLIGRISWGETVFLILAGELPAKEQARLLEAILVSVVDHGVRPPSTIAAVTAASTGASLSASVAAGLLAINKYHGGAIEDCMRALLRTVQTREAENLTVEEAARKVAADFKARGERVSGFGHRLHKDDPRTVRLFKFAEELKIAGKFVAQAKALERVLSERAGKRLPINADGAIAALLCEMNFPVKAANGIFMIARVAGLIAHAAEEQERNPPMRTVDPDEYEYDGADERSLKSLE